MIYKQINWTDVWKQVSGEFDFLNATYKPSSGNLPFHEFESFGTNLTMLCTNASGMFNKCKT